MRGLPYLDVGARYQAYAEEPSMWKSSSRSHGDLDVSNHYYEDIHTSDHTLHVQPAWILLISLKADDNISIQSGFLCFSSQEEF